VSKIKLIKSEVELQEAARELLAEDDVLHWRWKSKEQRRGRGIVDAVLELTLDERRYGFDTEFKLSPTASDLDRLVERKGSRPLLLIAPHLSDPLASHCRERGINCLDLNGRLWLRAEGLLVERQPTAANRFRPAIVPPDVFSLKSVRLVRTLLTHPGRVWTHRQLVERTGLSPGLVTRIVKHLINEGLVGVDQRAISLKRPDALLEAWAASDDWSRRTTVRQYSLLASDVEEIANQLLKHFPKDEPLVFTQWIAANLRHPYTTPPVVSAYVAVLPDERLERALNARRVPEGGTLWLLVSKDDGVFRETQRVGEFTLACDVQIYLDLLRVGLRGPEQAKALREWSGFLKGNA
jgi:hypothetical protein